MLFDVTRHAHHKKAHDRLAAVSGHLDIPINNAGIFLEGEPGVNDLYDAANVPEHVIRQTIEAANSMAYDTSKTAINAFTVHLAKALAGTRIKVNAAHPGWVQTEMGGSAAPMTVADGARTSVQLALLSDDGPSGGFYQLGEALPW